MAKILVISPAPSHPQDAGNRARIFSLLSELQKVGHKIHFLYLEMAGFKCNAEEMERQWDGFLKIPYRRPPDSWLKRRYDSLSRILGRNRVLKYRIDDWFDDSILPLVRELSTSLNPDIVLVEYTYVSKIFTLFGRDILKILDTHDVLGNRDLLFIKKKIPPKWFYTSEAEEKKGVDRADIILAIQPQEAAYFKKLSKKKVLTVGHVIKPAVSRGAEPKHPSRLIFVGSSNPNNLTGIKWFLENVFETLKKESPGIELDIVGNAADYVEPAPGLNLVGTVKALTPFYRNASVVINPLQFGTGLKIKTIEALAMKRPLVTTPNGATGIEDWAGRAFLCADTPEEFATAIFQIITSKELQNALTEGADEFIGWYNQTAFSPLEEEIDIFLNKKPGR
jgi:glycosyltransferase involved in cell wall biosynthesis